MPHLEIEGALQGEGLRVAIAVARFNSFITDRLLGGALDGLRRHGVAEEAVTVVRVPGSWELPVTVKALAESGKYDAVICLGAVIRGDTPHFDYVAGEAAGNVPKAILQAMYLTIADFYENRTDYVKRLPTAAEYLLDQFRVFIF